MTRNKWRRTDLNGEIAPDDWILLDPSGEPLARLYKVFGGPQDGRWYWTVLFRPDGSVGSGGTGFTATGREAWEACEALTGNDARSASIIARFGDARRLEGLVQLVLPVQMACGDLSLSQSTRNLLCASARGAVI
jgi:hypothetical protein